MFVRNKIPRYSSCPTPSSTSSFFSPLPSLLPKATHSAEPSFLFISAKFPPHQPQPSTPPPPPSLSLSLPSVSHHRHAKPPSTRPVTYPRTPPTKRRTAVMAAVTESIKVVLMRLNCRRYCRPAATLPPHSARILHPFFADADSTHLFRTFSIASTRLLCPSLSFSLEIDIPVPFP